MTFEEQMMAYLSKPCAECTRRATHNQRGRAVCNQHLDPNVAAFARDD